MGSILETGNESHTIGFVRCDVIFYSNPNYHTDFIPMKQAWHSKPLVGLMGAAFLVALLGACSQPDDAATEAATEAAAPEALAGNDEITSIDADGNVAPFGFASREPVEVPPLADQASVEPAAGPTDSGLYGVQCVACHGADATGIEGLGVSLVESEWVAASSAADLKEFLKVGRLPDSPDSTTGVPMPGFSWMTDEQLDEVVTYVKAL